MGSRDREERKRGRQRLGETQRDAHRRTGHETGSDTHTPIQRWRETRHKRQRSSKRNRKAERHQERKMLRDQKPSGQRSPAASP